MLRARDLMKRDVFTLPASLSAGEAAWALMHRGISGAPVRDTMGRLVGVVSNADLIDPERGPDQIDLRTVEDVMTPALLAVDQDDPAIEAVQLMVAHGVHRVLVLDVEGELVGIVTPMDFLRRLLAEGHMETAPDAGLSAAERTSHVTHH